MPNGFLSVDARPSPAHQADRITVLSLIPGSDRPTMSAIISVSNLSKTYGSGFKALNLVNLEIRRGEIFALLGPNGAGKTTLISIICGIANLSEGRVIVDGHDIKKDAKIMTLSGGMKRRVMIAKALAHEPQILFLDEPTAGVDVELRKGMWEVVRRLQASGVTIILTTHYIAEAEQMADRIGVINNGEIILVEDKADLMQKLGKKRLKLHLQGKIETIPPALAPYHLELSDEGDELTYTYDTKVERTGITSLLGDLRAAGIKFSDPDTTQSSLEDIFVSLVKSP